jgi:adenine/guanine phosphoribosyltransferase-like PRPP-binding protein
VHLVDDLIYSGQTLCAARRALQLAGLEATAASAILWTRRADAAAGELAAAGLSDVTCLTHQRLVEA